MSYTLILTLLFASMWDGSPVVKYEKQVDNLTEVSCNSAAEAFKHQYGHTDGRTTVIALCIRRDHHE